MRMVRTFLLRTAYGIMRLHAGRTATPIVFLLLALSARPSVLPRGVLPHIHYNTVRSKTTHLLPAPQNDVEMEQSPPPLHSSQKGKYSLKGDDSEEKRMKRKRKKQKRVDLKYKALS